MFMHGTIRNQRLGSRSIMHQNKKSFLFKKNFKKCFLFFQIKFSIFFINFSKFFPLLVHKILFSKLDICNLRRTGTSCSCYLGTCFMVILNLPVPNNAAGSFSGARDSSPSRFLFVIATPCCKYSKNNV